MEQLNCYQKTIQLVFYIWFLKNKKQKKHDTQMCVFYFLDHCLAHSKSSMSMFYSNGANCYLFSKSDLSSSWAHGCITRSHIMEIYLLECEQKRNVHFQSWPVKTSPGVLLLVCFPFSWKEWR